MTISPFRPTLSVLLVCPIRGILKVTPVQLSGTQPSLTPLTHLVKLVPVDLILVPFIMASMTPVDPRTPPYVVAVDRGATVVTRRSALHPLIVHGLLVNTSLLVPPSIQRCPLPLLSLTPLTSIRPLCLAWLVGK